MCVSVSWFINLNGILLYVFEMYGILAVNDFGFVCEETQSANSINSILFIAFLLNANVVDRVKL